MQNLNKGDTVNISKISPSTNLIDIHIDYMGRKGEEGHLPVNVNIYSIAVDETGKMHSADTDYTGVDTNNAETIVQRQNPSTLRVDLSFIKNYQEIKFFVEQEQTSGEGKPADRMPQLECLNIFVSDSITEEVLATYSMIGAAADAQAVTILIGALFKTEEGFWKFGAKGDASDFTMEHFALEYSHLDKAA